MSHHHKHGECHDHDSCCDDKCSSSCAHSHPKDEGCCHEDFAKHLLHVADCAWMDLLKEKIKNEIASSCGEHLDQIAKVVASSNGSKWKHKLGIMKDLCDYKEKLKNIFCCGDDSCNINKK